VANKLRTCFSALFALMITISGLGQTAYAVMPQDHHDAEVTVVNKLLVEASCGQCKFGLKGKGCDLAVRIDGKSFYVDGAKIDDHGDAHAADGMCNAIRLATVAGTIKDGRFVSSDFKMLPSTNEQLVEASCGACKFGMEGDGCDLAVRINGKSYYVDGAKIDDHGDAHGHDGMCNAIRQAKVKGEVKDDRFVATSFTLLPYVEELTVEASCGECQFGLEGNACDLAVRIDGKAHFVDGALMSDFGDAHGGGGMCNVVRSAKIKGTIVDGRFVSTSFKLLPFDGKSQPKKGRLGIALEMSGDVIVIREVIEDSPAEKAGLMKGDEIVSLNKVKLAGLEQEPMIALFKEFNVLNFSIVRDGKEMEISIELKSK